MTYVRINPFKEFETVAKELGKFVNDTVENNSTSTFNPGVDVYEDKENIYVELEVPGIAKDELKLSLNENVLTVKGEKKAAEKNDDKKYFWSERNYGEFSRSFRLPKDITADKIEAKYNNGVLTVVVPKAQPVKPEEKYISIN